MRENLRNVENNYRRFSPWKNRLRSMYSNSVLEQCIHCIEYKTVVCVFLANLFVSFISTINCYSFSVAFHNIQFPLQRQKLQILNLRQHNKQPIGAQMKTGLLDPNKQPIGARMKTGLLDPIPTVLSLWWNNIKYWLIQLLIFLQQYHNVLYLYAVNNILYSILS